MSEPIEREKIKNPYTTPIYEGSWCIGGSWWVNVKQKPTDEQIKNTEELLGWKWCDPV